MAKNIIVRICANTRYAHEKDKNTLTGKIILNDTEFDILFNQKEDELYEAEIVDGKYKLLKKVN